MFVMLSPSPWVLSVVYGASEMVLIRIRRPGVDAQVKDRSSFRVLLAVIWSCVFLSIIATYELGFARIHHASQYYPAGFALFVAGLALRWWSIIVLGRFFTVKVSIASDHRIVEKGPYRILRHPSYAGGLLAFLGLGICMSNWASIALLVIPTWFAYLWRIRVEEEALTEALGEEYRRYSARTYRLIPFVH
jgi:protein-S-isoprenylcysteine O-methyltransferase